MNQALKQRLVGTLVLGCLAIIFIPLLLDGEGVSRPAIDTTVPPPPDLSYRELPPPTRPLIDADTLPDTLPEDAAESTGAAANAVLADITAADAAGLPDGDMPVPAPPVAEPATTAAIPLPVPTDRSGEGASAADTTPQRDAAGLPQAWAIRVGVFSNSGNADTLRACLITEGFQAYSRGQDTGLTGIYVGPVLTRAEAVTLATRVKGKCGLSGDALVLRYSLQ